MRTILGTIIVAIIGFARSGFIRRTTPNYKEIARGLNKQALSELGHHVCLTETQVEWLHKSGRLI